MRAPVNPAKVKALLDLGASLIANHLHRVCPEVAAVAQMLEREFAARVAANVYCSFKGVQAFQTHFDLHDVFAVQAEGEKCWRVYEARADTPVTPLPPGDDVEKWLTASRGRLLFEAQHEARRHTLSAARPVPRRPDGRAGLAAHHLWRVAGDRARRSSSCSRTRPPQESAFRAYLPDARNEAALRERLAKLAERVRAMITSPAFAIDVLNHQRGLASEPTAYELPAQQPPSWYSIARPRAGRAPRRGLRRRLRARRDRAGCCLPHGRMAAQAADVLAGRRPFPPAGRRSDGAS